MVKLINKGEFKEKKFNTGNVLLNYVAGPDHGLPLVLIPAQMGIWESYQKVMPALSNKFHVFVVDIRGHGKSAWTTGDYCWKSVGSDIEAFLKHVVKRPAIISGNSSGGLIALWLAANVSDYVSGIILEDAPLFSAEMPRFRDKDEFVYHGLKHLVEMIGDVDNRDLADYFKDTVVPVKRYGKWRKKRVPQWIIPVFSFIIGVYQKRHPDQPVDIPFFPFTLRLLIKSLSMFDPDFARAFVDGRFYEGLDHEEALQKVRCPMLLLHARSERHPELGLIGAMDASDVEHACQLVPHMIYKKLEANHVIHVFRPKDFIKAVEEFGEVVRSTSYPEK